MSTSAVKAPSSSSSGEDNHKKRVGNCCGRKVSSYLCLSQKKLFTIVAIVGTLILILGILSLTSYYAPTQANSGPLFFLKRINEIGNVVASKLNSDLLTVSILTTSIGATLAISGFILCTAAHPC